MIKQTRYEISGFGISALGDSLEECLQILGMDLPLEIVDSFRADPRPRATKGWRLIIYEDEIEEY
jgi:hypothetical protein